MLRGKRILVVEDEAVLAGNLRDYFRRRGSQVALASGGDAALPLAEGFAPNVLVVSDALPGMDRLGVLQALRLRFPTALAVLLSECCEDLIQPQAWATGIDIVLEKPFSLSELEFAIEEAGSQPAGIAELSIPVAEILSPPPLQARI